MADSDKLFVHKYQPMYFDDFGKNKRGVRNFR